MLAQSGRTRNAKRRAREREEKGLAGSLQEGLGFVLCLEEGNKVEEEGNVSVMQ